MCSHIFGVNLSADSFMKNDVNQRKKGGWCIETSVEMKKFICIGKIRE